MWRRTDLRGTVLIKLKSGCDVSLIFRAVFSDGQDSRGRSTREKRCQSCCVRASSLPFPSSMIFGDTKTE